METLGECSQVCLILITLLLHFINRVQGEFGGSNTYADLSRFNETILANGQHLFEKIKKEKSPNSFILYCRLDVVIDWNSNNISICELELLEPHLYFETINPNDPSVAIQKENELYDSVVKHNIA